MTYRKNVLETATGRAVPASSRASHPVPGTSQHRDPSKRGQRITRLLDVERGWSLTAVFFALMVAVPWLSASSMPTLTEGLLVLLMCYAWNLVGGYLGEFSVAHMVFWGLGAYGTVLVINDQRALLPWVVAIVMLAAVGGLILAGIIKLSGLWDALTLAILTTVFAEIAVSIARGNETLGGAEGLIVLSLPSWSTEAMFLVVVALTAAAAFTNVALGNSKIGREWLAIRDDRLAAAVAGINVEARRALAYVISAGFFALGGAYQAFYSGYAIPEVSLGLPILFVALLAVFTGGHGTALGPLIGWVIIYGLQVLASQLSNSPEVSLYAQLAEFTAALVVLRIVLPRLRGNTLADALARLPRQVRARVADRGVAESAGPTSAELPAGGLENEALAATSGAARELSEGLRITGVSKSFGPLAVLRDVTFEVRPGEVVGILGPNGAGKTTLCNLISGIEPATSGSISLDGQEVSRLPVRKRSAVGMGRSFQTPRLFESLTLMQNLMLGAKALDEGVADGALAAMSIPNSRERRGDDSQFFARRLTEVLKANVQATSLLMLDEPLAGLTSEEHEIVLGMARRKAEEGACVLIVEHLIPVLAPAVDRIVVLHGGRIIADGPPEEVLKNETVVEAYLGSAHEMEERP
jgi:branched-chain amino acid transport system permease protein